VRPDIPAIEDAVPAVRRLMHAAGLQFKIAGGIAVAHHGYVRTTDDVDVLVSAAEVDRLDAQLAAHGFVRERRSRLRHTQTGTRVDLLLGGEPMPQPGRPDYPLPQAVAGSPDDPEVLSLEALVTLKLYARRHQDVADVVALLKDLDEAGYLALESAVPAELRTDLRRLRDDALDELRYADE
jgi:hypothetical protein